MDAPLALQEYLEYVVGGLITVPERASIGHEVTEAGVIAFRVVVAEEDAGILVGRNGYTVSAIKSLLAAGAERNGIKASLKLFTVSKEGEERAVGSGWGGGGFRRRERDS